MHEHTNHDTVRHRWTAVKDCEYFLAIAAYIAKALGVVACAKS
jgi:hypothetical protein